MTNLDAMKALNGNNSDLTARALREEIGRDRGTIAKLRQTPDVDRAALDSFNGQVNRVETLLNVARSETSSFGQGGKEITTAEKGILRGAVAQKRQAGVAALRGAQTDACSVSNPSAASENANDPYVSSGGKTYRPAPTSAELKDKNATLREGDRGPAVKELQTKLKAGGFDVEADGYYGPETQKAVDEYKGLYRPDGQGSTGKGIKQEDFAVLTQRAYLMSPEKSPDELTCGPAAPKDPGTQLSDALAEGDSGRVNDLVTQMTPKELAAAKSQVGAGRFEQLVANTSTGKGQPGWDLDYRDALQAATGGERRSLDSAGAREFARNLASADVDENPISKGLNWISGGAWKPGTNEAVVNRLHTLDDKSLKAVDTQLRDQGYEAGLRGFINDNYGSADDSHKTRDLFLKRFDAAGL